MLGVKPIIISHPNNQVLSIDSYNESLSLNCTAVGAVSYGWEKQDGSILSGATGLDTNSLTIVNIKPQVSGLYRCIVSNDNEKCFSDWATVTIKGW